MAKHKLQHFAENLTFPNMFQLRFEELKQGFVHKGKWNEFFGNNNPIVLELGCGKGEYTVNLAERYPGFNFIGVDVKGARMWKGCKASNVKGMKNVAFIRTHVQVIWEYFASKEVSEIWITFPDPFPKLRDAKRRLSAKSFLERYKKISKPDAVLHFKTDDLPLFLFTKEMAEELSPQIIYSKENIYSAPLEYDELNIQTYYEKQHLAKGRTINYIRFPL